MRSSLRLLTCTRCRNGGVGPFGGNIDAQPVCQGPFGCGFRISESDDFFRNHEVRFRGRARAARRKKRERATMTPCASQANRTVSIQLVQKPIISFMVYDSRYPERGTAPQRDQENITQTSQNLLKPLKQNCLDPGKETEKPGAGPASNFRARTTYFCCSPVWSRRAWDCSEFRCGFAGVEALGFRWRSVWDLPSKYPFKERNVSIIVVPEVGRVKILNKCDSPILFFNIVVWDRFCSIV